MIMNILKDIRIYLISVFGLVITITISGQSRTENYNLLSMKENGKLEVFNRELSTFSENNIEGIRFSKNQNDGMAWLKGVEFSDGTVELDIRGKDAFQQSFLGVAFHGTDNQTYDAVYFRPFNFRSTDPVRKIHGVQYISHPDYTWQILREKYNGKYEKAVNPPPDGNDWFHVKIIIKYPMIHVYVNGNTDPCLSTEKLNKRTSGKIGFWVGNGSDGDFANFKIILQN